MAAIGDDAEIGVGAHGAQRGFRAMRLALQGMIARAPDADDRRIDLRQRRQQQAAHTCRAAVEPRMPAVPVLDRDGKRIDTRGVEPKIRVTHWAQAKLGWGSPVFAFDRIDARISRMAARDGAPSGWAPFVTRWRAAEWGLVMRGKSGAEEALQWLRECDGLANTS